MRRSREPTRPLRPRCLPRNLPLSTSLRTALIALLLVSGLTAQVKVDENLPEYEAVQGVSGSIKSVGSDTMNNLMTLWAEGFLAVYPNVQVEIEGKGSSTAPPALVAGSANFGPMSRTMKKEEVESFEKAYGYRPTELNTSIDMLAVYVNKDNPVRGLTLQQVDAMFSKARKGGAPAEARTWGDVGLTGAWARQPISLYGRNSASGTYGYFKEKALFKGDYKDSVKEQPGSSAVVQGVATDKFGVGYSGIGYITADVRAVPLALDERSEAIPADADHAYTGEYPLARFLKLYVNKEPNKELDPLRREFLKYIFSRQGQRDVVKAGYYPVTAEIAAESLAAIGLQLERAGTH
ncbi:MAG: PstS family phosphate ABC transporter substrate-binding protein [Planctomycetes bacterium]|nr:PstS family phosphate ABC transporter substrate-binding protein [Planctomycetota bacterium]